MATAGRERVQEDHQAESRVARVLTEVLAPKYFVMGLPLVVGVVTGGWAGLGWALLAAGLCGGIPGLVIWAGVKSGRFVDRHVTDRAQRPWLIGVIVALVVLALALLVVLGAPRVMVACVAIMLATLAVLGPITLFWKISFHTAVAAGSVVMVAAVLPPLPVFMVGGALVAAIGWSRVTIQDHTPTQVTAGAMAGAAATWATLALLL
ncbi:phosphatase PAP2 family protein [Nonomuraea sp. NPDC059023]|uniref:phosphatase PAP2 family protein n=1 Tax=unclassified Nonomuraea TaxID=2593643 RepID=UPI0036807762